MRKKLSVLSLALFLAIFVCVAVCAARTEFRGFSVEVPEGWTAKEEGSTVTISAGDGSAAVTVTLDTTGGGSLEETAKAFSRELGGSEPQMEAGVYRFTFKTPKGADSVMLISGEGKNFTAVGITGNHPEAEKIVDSLRAK